MDRGDLQLVGLEVHRNDTEGHLLIDGELDVAVAKSGAITVNTDSLFIGWVDNNRYFDGIIDDVMIWYRGLSAEELTDFLAVSSKDKLATCWAALKRPDGE